MEGSNNLSELLHVLEDACNNVDNPRTRQAAEETIAKFKASSHLLPKCQYILEHTHQPMLQFQTAGAIIEATVREYNEYQESDVSAFVGFLIHYCVHQFILQRYVRDAILRSAAVALKRLSMSLTYNVTPQILSLVQNLAEPSSSAHAKLVYLSCLTEYLDTFIPSQTAKQATFHLPLEQHLHSKTQLDSHILQPLWITLTQVLDAGISQTPSEDPVMQKAVICCERIISWDFGIEEGTFRRVSFGPTTEQKQGEEDEDEDKQPIWPGSWGSAINSFVVELMFKVYGWMQNGLNSLGSKHARQCLIYLAKLHGPALSSPQERQEHIYSFFNNLETSLSALARASRQIHEPGPHALHLAQLTHTLLQELRITAGLGLLCQTPTLLHSITLAWKFLLSSAPYEEGNWFWDAASHFAATWALILSGLGKMEWDPLARGVVRDLRKEGAEMVSIYVHGRLSWAERQASEEEDEDMALELETKDWESYDEELTNWAGVVRPVSSESLSFIFEAVSSRFDEFSRFDDLHNNHMLYCLNEQIHWSLLMTGYFLADAPPTPDEPYVGHFYTTGSESGTQIAAKVFTFFDSVGDVEDDKWSPQVVETLYWWFQRWGFSYLYASEDPDGIEIGVPGGGSWSDLAIWSIARMRKDVDGWVAEPEVISQIITTLKTFSRIPRVRNGMLLCGTTYIQGANVDNMPYLFHHLIEHISDLPQASHSDLVSAIVMLASGVENHGLRDFYMNLLVDPIQERFNPVFRSGDLTSREMDKICDAIEMLEGIFNPSHSSILAMIFRFMLKFLQPIASLLARVNIESSIAIASLRLFELLTRKVELTEEWAAAEKKRTEIAIGELLTNFKHWSDDTHGLDDEDEPCIDVCYISDMLVNMIAGDTLQLGGGEAWSFNLFTLGLDVMLPKMDENNWKVIQPSMHFSSLLQRMFEHQTQQILEQPQERITELCQCLVYCIRNPLHEVQESGFRAILSFAMFIRQNSAPPSLAHVLESILAETMASLFVGGVDSESVSNACAAVHGLAIILPDKYGQLLQSILHRCQGEKHERLGQALEKFTVSTRKKFESMGMEMDPEGNVRDLVSAREVEINEQEIWASLEVIWGVLRVR